MKEADIRPAALFSRFLELTRADISKFFDDPTLFQPVPCPACGAAGSEFAFEKLGFSYRICADCDSLYLSARPSPAAINAYYRESDAIRFFANEFFRQTAEARRERLFRPRARLVAEWADRVGLEPAGTFADVGAGYGIFLEEVAGLGRFGAVVGIEPAPAMSAACRGRGFRVVEKPVEEVGPEDLQATFMTAFEVIEHVHDPLAFLQAIRNRLASGGLLLFTTLTVSGFDIRVLWERSKSVYPPHHVNLLSLRGLERLIERAGLDCLELTTPGELDVDIVRNAVLEDPGIGLPRVLRTILFDVPDETREAFQRFLGAHRLSSHVRVIARRAA